jgi:hypothetical protein
VSTAAVELFRVLVHHVDMCSNNCVHANKASIERSMHVYVCPRHPLQALHIVCVATMASCLK